MNPVLVPLVVEILLLARTQGLGVAVERVARFVQDPLTIFTTFLLLCYSYGRHMVLVSPWVENVIPLPTSVRSADPFSPRPVSRAFTGAQQGSCSGKSCSRD